MSHLTQHEEAYFGTPNRSNEEMATMAAERSKVTFPVRELTYFFYGGEEEVKYRELANTIISRDPVLLKKRPFDLDSKQDRALTMKQIRRAIEVMNGIKDPKLRNAFRLQMAIYDRNYGMRLYVHATLFRETIWAQGTKEQFQQWVDDIDNMRVIGCFALTELGHSSFIRGSETYAIYDEKTQEFIINSGSLLATKWWIGMAGECATHTVALCNLVIRGKVVGLHWFIIPLRDRNDGHLLPGVSAGFLGPKAGRNGLDNGWIQFTHVRIPRTNMLMRWATVSPEGEYRALPNQALSYGTLIGERLLALEEVINAVGQASTIAVRYALVRRQGEQNEQILNYQVQQRVLLPIVAGVYAIRIIASDIVSSWTEVQERFDRTNNEAEYLSKISDYHGTGAGLKACLGWWGADALEITRRSLGGHAYSAYNAVAGLIGDYSVVTTGGGDNYVLAQQCARYLLGSLARVRSGKPIGASVAYFTNHETLLRKKSISAKSPEDFLRSDIQLEALSWLSVASVTALGKKLQDALGSGQSPHEAWNNLQTELIESIRPHVYFYVAERFAKKVESAKHLAGIYPVLKKLYNLFTLDAIQRLGLPFLEFGYLTAADLDTVKQLVLQLCRDLRADAAGLVDAFNYPDFILKAPLGRYDGDIYRAYFETITSVEGSQERPWYFDEVVKPMTQTTMAKL